MIKRTSYSNNPLKIAIDGIKAVFQKAPMAAIVLAFLSAIMATSRFKDQSRTHPEGTPEASVAALEPGALIVLIIIMAVLLFGLIVIGSIISGIFAYTSAEVAKGHEVTFRQAVKATFDRLWSYVGLQLLTLGKILLWSLLFIIPGIIMAVRYSLANLSFFDSDKKLTGNAAIKDSLALTKDAWLTTFASQMFLNIITLGMISPIVDTGSKAMLYRQFSELEKTESPKPKPHMLSWVTLWFTIFITIIAISAMAILSAKYGVSSI